jgi:hypothetical protein
MAHPKQNVVDTSIPKIHVTDLFEPHHKEKLHAMVQSLPC